MCIPVIGKLEILLKKFDFFEFLLFIALCGVCILLQPVKKTLLLTYKYDRIC